MPLYCRDVAKAYEPGIINGRDGTHFTPTLTALLGYYQNTIGITKRNILLMCQLKLEEFGSKFIAHQ